MTGTLVRSTRPAETEVFFCPEESHFYSHCLERLVFQRCDSAHHIVEFGAGDGGPVINSLVRAASQIPQGLHCNATIHGYELNPSACEVAQNRIAQCNLEEKYIIHNTSFFDADHTQSHYLIANPPYIPAPDNKICMPLLHGGIDGATITNRLLTLNCPNVMLLVSSYSNPINTIIHALEQGYSVADFMITPLKFGYYSSEPKVKEHITELRNQGQAFYSQNIYFLAGVLFQKHELCKADLSKELLQVMTAL